MEHSDSVVIVDVAAVIILFITNRSKATGNVYFGVYHAVFRSTLILIDIPISLKRHTG